MMWRSPSAVYEGLTSYFLAGRSSAGWCAESRRSLARFFMGMLFAHIMGCRIFGTANFEEVADYCVDIFLNGILLTSEAKDKENQRGLARD